MEYLSALVRTVIDNGWRLGIILLFGGGAVMLADRYAFPRQHTVEPWLAWATIAFLMGCALLAASACAQIGTWFVAKVREQIAKIHEHRNALSNLQTLQIEEAKVLEEICAAASIAWRRIPTP